MKTLIDTATLDRALALRDLTEPHATPHAVAHLVQRFITGLPERGWPRMEVVRGPRIVTDQANYGLLGYQPEEITLGSEHTRWVSDTTLLRTQTTSGVTGHLPQMAHTRGGAARGMVAPGITYRRDNRDRWHCAEPHQMDVWVVMDPDQATSACLDQLITDILTIALPGHRWKTEPSPHHYTAQGREVQVLTDEGPIEVMECGLIAPDLLTRLGVNSNQHAGLALGMGLDRLVMLRKGVPDIRLLRDPDPRVAAQMLTLSPWKPVSRQPAAKRDLSLAVPRNLSEEALTEQVLAAAGDQASWIEAVRIKGRWKADQVPEMARERLDWAWIKKTG